MERDTGRQQQPLLTRNDPDPMSAFYWGAFWSLSQSRPVGYDGALPIPISEMAAYCAAMGIGSPQGRADFIRTMQTMDGEYLSYIESRKPKGRQ